jgi:outer membrane lipoprotein-sorting protein
LGAETVNGRATIKYRVTLKGQVGTAKEITTESLVWVDEGLGMPIKSEMTSTGSGAGNAHVTMELRDLKETVDESLFRLPTGYRRVEAADIFAQLKQIGQP